MKCNKCGFENPDNAKFCNWCGEKLELETPTQDPVQQVSNNKKCQICGTENEADAKYCAVCGSQLSSVAQNTIFVNSEDRAKLNIYAQKEDKFGKSSMIVGIVALASTVLCCGYAFPLGIVGGILSVIFGILSLKQGPANQGKAIAGIVCGAIAFLIGIIILISVIVVLNDPALLEEIQKMLQESGYY